MAPRCPPACFQFTSIETGHCQGAFVPFLKGFSTIYCFFVDKHMITDTAMGTKTPRVIDVSNRLLDSSNRLLDSSNRLLDSLTDASNRLVRFLKSSLKSLLSLLIEGNSNQAPQVADNPPTIVRAETERCNQMSIWRLDASSFIRASVIALLELAVTVSHRRMTCSGKLVRPGRP